jgi:hypothetical protein
VPGKFAVENNQRAKVLRDNGRVAEARQVLLSNGAFLGDNARRYKSSFLLHHGSFNSISADNLDGDRWSAERKQTRYELSRVRQGQ